MRKHSVTDDNTRKSTNLGLTLMASPMAKMLLAVVASEESTMIFPE